MGHKISHSFTKTNVEFGYVFHPRFGHIRSVVATKAIAKKEELFLDYGYGTTNPNVPKWYKEAYLREIGMPYPAQGRQQQCL